MTKRKSKKMFHHQEETLCNLAHLEHSEEENRDILDNTHYVHDPVEYQKNNRIYNIIAKKTHKSLACGMNWLKNTKK